MINILQVRFGFSYSKQFRYIGLMIFFLRSSTTRLPFTEAATGGVLCKQVFLKISQNSQQSNCAWVSFLTKWQPATLLKKRLWHMCFPVNSAKFLTTPLLLLLLVKVLLVFLLLFSLCGKLLSSYISSNSDCSNKTFLLYRVLNFTFCQHFW